MSCTKYHANIVPNLIYDNRKEKQEPGSKEHKANVTHGCFDKSDLAHHCWTENLQMDWDNIPVIDEDKNWKNRLLQESIHYVLSTPCIKVFAPLSIRPLLK